MGQEASHMQLGSNHGNGTTLEQAQHGSCEKCDFAASDSARVCVQDKHLASILQECPQLEALSLRGYQGNMSYVLVAAAQHCAALVRLDLAECRTVDDHTMRALSRWPLQLQELAMPQCENVSPEGLCVFLDHHRRAIRVLDIRGTRAAEPLLEDYLLGSNLQILKIGGFSKGVLRLWALLTEKLPRDTSMQVVFEVCRSECVRSVSGRSW
jgi:hypothetical protein